MNRHQLADILEKVGPEYLAVFRDEILVALRSGKKAVKTSVASTPLPDWIDPEKWRSWLAIRPAKARSDAAQRAALDKLAAWKALGMDPNVIVGESLANGWQGLFLPKSGGITGGMSLGEKNRAAADEAVRRMAEEQREIR